MSDRLPMPSAMSAELAEKLSDRAADVTDADIDRAITAIIEDHLLLGYCYPRKGGKNCVVAGMIVQDCADFEDIECMLTALVYGCGDQLDKWQRYAESIVKEHGPRYLREHRYELIERMIEEMAEEDE